MEKHLKTMHVTSASYRAQLKEVGETLIKYKSIDASNLGKRLHKDAFKSLE